MKRQIRLIVLGLLVLALGSAMVVAQEPTEQPLPWRARVMEILEKHPEVWEEVQSLRQEHRESLPELSEDAKFSDMWCGGPMMRRQHLSRVRMMDQDNTPMSRGRMIGHKWSR